MRKVQCASVCACVGRGKVRSVGSAAQVAITEEGGALEKSVQYL